MYDFILIGGGIVGLATARELQSRFPQKRLLLLEKEPHLAAHQSGRNSGVIHAGVYYTPGSLKAEFCKQGLQDTIAFCRTYDIAYEQCGKLLVATSELELERMHDLAQRSAANGIAVELLDQAQLREREPNIVGLGALYVSETGIADYPAICRKLGELFVAAGGELRRNVQVQALLESEAGVKVITSAGTFNTQQVIACAGLQADRLVDATRLSDGSRMPRDFQIVPFRGEYLRLVPEKTQLIKHLIYPIPDPELPFLGVHLTRMIDGSITVGPNAVLGWQREGYGRCNFSLRDSLRMLSFKGLWPLLRNHWRSGLGEFKDAWWRRGYLQRVQKYCPSLGLEDLENYPTGVRAQAVMNDGSLVQDFLFAKSERTLQVCNAPSPAATSAMPIARYICDQLTELKEQP